MNKKTRLNWLLAARFLGFLGALMTISCASNAKTMPYGTGTVLGNVSVSAILTENHETGEITGDTGKYGSFDRPMSSTLERELKGASSRRAELLGEEVEGLSLGEKAYGMAVYQVIQQVRALKGKAVGNVLTEVERHRDPETNIETITVSITADAIKPAKKK